MRRLLAASAPALCAGLGVAHADPSRSPACDPGNAPPGARADWPHQSRPGGSDCTPGSALRSDREALARQGREPRGERRGERERDRRDERDEGSYGLSSRGSAPRR